MMSPIPRDPNGRRPLWHDALLVVLPVLIGECLAMLRDKLYPEPRGHCVCVKCGTELKDIHCLPCLTAINKASGEP